MTICSLLLPSVSASLAMLECFHLQIIQSKAHEVRGRATKYASATHVGGVLACLGCMDSFDDPSGIAFMAFMETLICWHANISLMKDDEDMNCNFVEYR